MLPTDVRDARRMSFGGGFQGGSSLLPPYIRRALSSHQMDWEYAFTQMVYCCTAPSKVCVRHPRRPLHRRAATPPLSRAAVVAPGRACACVCCVPRYKLTSYRKRTAVLPHNCTHIARKADTSMPPPTTTTRAPVACLAETKDQWSRDDPAFVFIMTGFLLVSPRHRSCVVARMCAARV